MKHRSALKIASIAVLAFVATAFAVHSFAFTGPSASGGTGGGFIGVGSAGNVSVGTSTPLTGTMLFVVGSSSDSSYYAIKAQNSAGSPLLIIRNDGSIAIATSTLTAGATTMGGNLTISGALSAATLGASTINANNVSAGTFASSTGGGNFSFPANVTASNFYSPSTAGTFGDSGGAKIIVYGSTGSAGITNALRFDTAGNERMRIDSSGNVTIGTTTPQSAALTIQNNINSNVITAFTASGINIFNVNLNGTIYTGTGLGNINGGVSNAYIQPTTNGTVISRNIADGNSSLIVNQSNAGSTGDILDLQAGGVTKLAFSQSGYLGIGTTTPASPLTISTAADVPLSIRTSGNGYAALSLKATGGDTGINLSSGNYYWGMQVTSDNGLTLQDRGASNGSGFVAFKIMPGGNIGISTTSAAYPLTVAGTIAITGSGNGLRFPDGTTQTTASGGSSQWTTTSTGVYYNSGNVGIGTASPGAKLDINGTLSVSGNQTVSTDSYTTYGPNSSWSSYLRVGGNGRTVSGDAYASVVTTNGNLHLDAGNSRATYLNYYGGTSGVNFGNGASGVIGSVSSAGNLSMNGAGTFGTNAVINGAGSSYFNGGNVGIGLTSPGSKLEIAGGDIAIDNSFTAGPRTYTTSDKALITFTQGGYDRYLDLVAGSDGSGGWNGSIRFLTTASAGPVTAERMRITGNGYVGIGTTTPQSALSVVGSYYSNYFANANSTTTTSVVNWNNSNVQSLKLGSSPTLTFTNVQPGGRYILLLIQDVTGSRTVTWPASVQWSGGTAPTLTTTANKMDVVSFVCAAASGTNCYGAVGTNYSQ